MIIAWTPTVGHTYKVFKRRNGVETLLGSTNRGEFIISARKGYEYYVKVVNETGKPSRISNIIVKP